MGKWLGEQMIIYKFFKASLSREAFIMSEFLLVVVVVVLVVSVWCPGTFQAL